MTDVSVIILTKDEKLHIKRCLERLAPLEPRQVFIVDCFSTDGTQEIVEKWKSGRVEENREHKTEDKVSGAGADCHLSSVACPFSSRLVLVEHEWPGLYAKQFNWALDSLPIEAKWVLRLDADEYLTSDTIERLKVEFPKLTDDVTGLTLELKRRFMGGEIRHGTSGIRLLRIFRNRIGRCEERAMDEHIVLSEGRAIDFDGVFYDDNLNSFEWWQEKHRGYAKREAMDASSLFGNSERLNNPSATDRKKIQYYKLPRYFRAIAYFCLRYFLKLGFLDGIAGFRWHFWQGLWYRWIVDREIGRMKGRVAN